MTVGMILHNILLLKVQLDDEKVTQIHLAAISLTKRNCFEAARGYLQKDRIRLLLGCLTQGTLGAASPSTLPQTLKF